MEFLRVEGGLCDDPGLSQGKGEGFCLFQGGDHRGLTAAVADLTDHLRVVPLADDHGELTGGGDTGELELNLLDQGAGGVDEKDPPLPEEPLLLRRDTVAADDDGLSRLEEADLLDAEGALPGETFHRRAVVDQGAEGVDGLPPLGKSRSDHVESPADTETEARLGGDENLHRRV